MKAGIRISGFGGQGIILSGVIVGKAAVFDGFNVVQTQSYGPEARGDLHVLKWSSQMKRLIIQKLNLQQSP